MLDLNTRAEMPRDGRLDYLKEYHTWEKVATIIYEGKEIRVMAGLVQIHKRAKRS